MPRPTGLFIVLALTLGLAPPAAAAAPTAPAAPTGAEAALTNVVSVAAGQYNGCAVLVSGQVRCWGDNGQGTVGNGSATDLFTTAQTVRNANGSGPLGGVRQVVVGDLHACALLTSGQVRCWGDNDDGELGNGNAPTDSGLPVTVRNGAGTLPLTNVIQISAEADGTCALLASRQVRCWGDDDYGQLGDAGGNVDHDLPVVVKGVRSATLTDVAALGGGYDNNCVALRNGRARCWGYNAFGNLGDGSTVDRTRPVVVRSTGGGGALTGVTQISNGGYHACARLSGGTAVCWGLNEEGALGDGGVIQRPRPGYVTRNGIRLTGVRSVHPGNDHTCAIVANGGVQCWGADDFGQNGDGTYQAPENRLTPNAVRNVADTGRLTGITQLDAGKYHNCARTNTGQARCWGYGEFGGLGDGDTDLDVLPRPVRA